MLINPSLRLKYGPFDADCQFFVNKFDLQIFPVPELGHEIKILEVGANEEYLANLLTEMGYEVIGVDLREYHARDEVKHPQNYRYVRCDINAIKIFDAPDQGFDAIICLSAIEHFGLGTYDEGRHHPYYDVIGAHTMWRLLKTGGVLYLTVPFGKRHRDVFPHWRVYDKVSLSERLIQDFDVADIDFFASADVDILTPSGTMGYKKGQRINPFDAMCYDGEEPNVSAFVKLVKGDASRISPDGR